MTNGFGRVTASSKNIHDNIDFWTLFPVFMWIPTNVGNIGMEKMLAWKNEKYKKQKQKL